MSASCSGQEGGVHPTATEVGGKDVYLRGGGCFVVEKRLSTDMLEERVCLRQLDVI